MLESWPFQTQEQEEVWPVGWLLRSFMMFSMEGHKIQASHELELQQVGRHLCLWASCSNSRGSRGWVYLQTAEILVNRRTHL